MRIREDHLRKYKERDSDSHVKTEGSVENIGAWGPHERHMIARRIEAICMDVAHVALSSATLTTRCMINRIDQLT